MDLWHVTLYLTVGGCGRSADDVVAEHLRCGSLRSGEIEIARCGMRARRAAQAPTRVIADPEPGEGALCRPRHSLRYSGASRPLALLRRAISNSFKTTASLCALSRAENIKVSETAVPGHVDVLVLRYAASPQLYNGHGIQTNDPDRGQTVFGLVVGATSLMLR